jgi:response regulator RpfG family c-di-GMP phosphodiesterase
MSSPAEVLETNEQEFTILCVDDEKSILSSLRRLFRTHPYQIITAESGDEGLKILEKKHVDLIISDMRMPQMTGAVFLAEVSKRWPDTIRILLTGYADLESTIAAVNDGAIYRYISKPWDENDLLITIKRGLEIKSLEAERNKLLEITKSQNDELQELNSKLEGMVDDRTETIQKTYNEIISVFTQIIELREGLSSNGHAKRVSELTRKISKVLKLSKKEEVDIYMASLLHDIGKVGLEDSIIKEPYNQLSPKQKEEYRRHTVTGPAILGSLPLLTNASKIIRSHHERYDGTGYPDGLLGNDIPIGAQLIAIANDYDDLICGTQSGSKMDWKSVIQLIQDRSGEHYAPNVVKAFMEVMKVENDENAIKEYVTASKNLEPGMILSRDLLTESEILLLSKGQELDEHIIEKIQEHEHENSESLNIYILKK